MKANKREGRMKHLIITLILTSSLFANEKTWSSHSAEILEQGRWEIGLFQPLRYGYSNYAEFSIHPGWFFLIPNLEIKEAQKINDVFALKGILDRSLSYRFIVYDNQNFGKTKNRIKSKPIKYMDFILNNKLS